MKWQTRLWLIWVLGGWALCGAAGSRLTAAAENDGESRSAAEARLPAAIATTLEQGQAAAERGDLVAAIRLFQRVRETVPQDPHALYLLGLAHQAAGHPLPAIAWYRAYLAAAPDSQAAPDVRQRIAHLNAANERHIRQLLAVEMRRLSAIPAVDDAAYGRHIDEVRRHVVAILAALGDRTSVAQLVGASQPSPYSSEVVMGFADARRFREAAAANIDRDRLHAPWLAVYIFLKQADAGDYAGAVAGGSSWPPLGDYWPIARVHVRAGKIDEALRHLGRYPTLGKWWVRREDPESAELLRKASPAAIREFIDAYDEKSDYGYSRYSQPALYTLISAMLRWGYLDEAQQVVALVEDPQWRAVLEVDLYEARAGLRQITRYEQVDRLTEILVRYRKDCMAHWYATLSLAAACVTVGEMEAASKVVEILKQYDTSRQHDYKEITTSKSYEIKPEAFDRRAVRILLEAQAEVGDFDAARRTSEYVSSTLFEDRSLDIFLAAAAPDAPDFERPLGKPGATFVFNDNALFRAAKLHARQGDSVTAKKIANTRISHIVNSWQARSLAAIAAAEFHRGDEAAARMTLNETLQVLDADLVDSFLEMPPYHLPSRFPHEDKLRAVGMLPTPVMLEAFNLPAQPCRQDELAIIAAELAEANYAEGLRELTRYAVHSSGGQSLECLCQRLSQLQQSVGDFEGARETREQAAHYRRELEIADWSIVARALENDSLRYVNHFAEFCREIQHEPEKHAASDAASRLLRFQHSLRDRDDRWRQRREASD